MSTVVRPSGPLPPKVYWVRRLMLLLVVLLVLFGLVKLFGGDDDPAAASSPPRPGERPTPAAPENPPERVERAHPKDQVGQEKNKRRHREKARPLADPDGPCRPADVKVKPVVSAENEAGDPVEIRLRMRTTGRPACTLTVGPDNLLVRVTSGEDRIWTSQECPTAIVASKLVVRSKQPLTYRVPWSGQRSAPRCPLRTEKALPGTYVAAAAIIGGEPAETRFVLEPESATNTVIEGDKPEKPNRR